MKRRNFLRSGALAASGAIYAGTGNINAASLAGKIYSEPPPLFETVNFTRDGLDFSPAEQVKMLEKIVSAGEIHADDYSNGGVVEELENKFARLLGKESAVFMPTGTMANHIALRMLAGDRKRILVQEESHIYNDSGDCCQQLSGLNLVPLVTAHNGFTLEDVRAAVERTATGRVTTGVGVISIESPVRRRNNQVFSYPEMGRIADYAKQNGINMHLDGARLFNAVGHTGISPIEYSKLFDTVYISLYKCFNAPSGAILAGTEEFTRNLYHTRRMLGGGIVSVWQSAAIALQFADTFLDDYREALDNAGQLKKILEKRQEFSFEQIPDGTNVFILKMVNKDPLKVRERLGEQNIILPAPGKEPGTFYMKVNPSINRTTPGILAERFIEALG